MDVISWVYVRGREWGIARRYARLTVGKGQTMTEYAMMVSVIALVLYAGYRAFGTSASTLLTSIDGSL
jgi:Flp pilus assembly pilin Flp